MAGTLRPPLARQRICTNGPTDEWTNLGGVAHGARHRLAARQSAYDRLPRALLFACRAGVSGTGGKARGHYAIAWQSRSSFSKLHFIFAVISGTGHGACSISLHWVACCSRSRCTSHKGPRGWLCRIGQNPEVARVARERQKVLRSKAQSLAQAFAVQVRRSNTLKARYRYSARLQKKSERSPFE